MYAEDEGLVLTRSRTTRAFVEELGTQGDKSIQEAGVSPGRKIGEMEEKVNQRDATD